jgi:hypothetical protein
MLFLRNSQSVSHNEIVSKLCCSPIVILTKEVSPKRAFMSGSSELINL